MECLKLHSWLSVDIRYDRDLVVVDIFVLLTIYFDVELLSTLVLDCKSMLRALHKMRPWTLYVYVLSPFTLHPDLNYNHDLLNIVLGRCCNYFIISNQSFACRNVKTVRYRFSIWFSILTVLRGATLRGLRGNKMKLKTECSFDPGDKLTEYEFNLALKKTNSCCVFSFCFCRYIYN